MIYYDYNPSSLSSSGLRNTTDVDYTSPLNVGFVGPSVTPRTGYNAGWRMYQVDSSTFSVVDFQTYYADVSQASMWTTPEWNFEYDARTVYDPLNMWGKSDPLNATFWNEVTTNMLTNISLVEMYNSFETKVDLDEIVLTTDERTDAKLFEPRMCTAKGVLDPKWLGSIGVGMLEESVRLWLLLTSAVGRFSIRTQRPIEFYCV